MPEILGRGLDDFEPTDEQEAEFRRRFGYAVNDPRHDADAYEITDPKHPFHHDVFSDVADLMREP